MPTREEEEELYSNCTWTWTTKSNVDGFLVTGPSGNSIFLPTTGLYDGDSSDEIKRADTGGWYWSSTTNGDRYACGICFPTPGHLYQSVPNHEREDGHVIRPVLAGNNTTEIGIVVKRINGDDVKIPIGEIESIQTYENLSGYGNDDEHEAMDMGLSVKWATCNVGADSPFEAGDYYSWSETEVKDIYNSGTYVGTYELENISGTAYDVAHVKWKGDWRMPTMEEIKELYQKCSREWVTENGVLGERITAANGNSIFIPVVGRMTSDVLEGDNSAIYLWSGNYAAYKTAFGFLSSVSGIYWNRYDRYWGFQVRPVRP